MPRKYEVDPDKDTRFKPGQSGNPGGVTSQQMEKRRANRDAAFELEERLLKALKRDMDERESNIVDHIRADVLKLIHVAIEREDGKPVARVDNTSSDGSMSLPSRIILSGPDDDSTD
jgi:hypothetical protein